MTDLMWYKPKNEASLATPCILLFPDRIEENINRMIHIAGSASRLRPHVKTHKIAEVIKLQLQAGINSYKCATLTEVEMVANAGGADILLAYPLLGPSLGIWFELRKRFPRSRLSVTVDSESAIRQVESQARDRGTQAELFVDIDNGMHRTGIGPEQALPIIISIVESPHLTFRGLHIYDGHIHAKDRAARKKQCDRDFIAVSDLIKQLGKKGILVEELACGGTPTFPIHAGDPSRTLCPGTPLLWDAGYESTLPDLDFLPAAVVASRVISKPAGQLCLDLGYKAIASEMEHPRMQLFDLEADEVINHSEEHLVLKAGKAGQFTIGDVVYALPTHICPTMALHEKVYVVRKQQVSESWRVIARKRIYSF